MKRCVVFVYPQVMIARVCACVCACAGGLPAMFNALEHPGHNRSSWCVRTSAPTDGGWARRRCHSNTLHCPPRLQFSRLLVPDPTAQHSAGDSFWAMTFGLGISSLGAEGQVAMEGKT